MAYPFLTARWSNLFLATYAVPPALLHQHLPAGLGLELRNGQAFVSLVAFDFRDTRVLGLPWPGYRHFTEMNLRYYVHHGGERGVAFIREFVPQRLAAWLARLLYNEPYLAAPLASTVHDEPSCLTVEYSLRYAGRTHTLKVTGKKPPHLPDQDSDEHFFKEHHWGFGISRRGQPLRYAVEHPLWQVYPVQSYHIDLDWSVVYGPEWELLRDAMPCSTILAVGSAVAVYPKGRLAHCTNDAPRRPALVLRASNG